MNDALLRVLEEQITQPLPALINRDVRVPSADGIGTALVGMRRVGKSYLLFQQMSQLLQSGVPRSSMLFLNLEDDRLPAPTVEMLDAALEHLFRNGPARYEEMGYLFLDEVQVVPRWEQFVLRVLNTEKIRVFVTGSSAKLLSSEIATGLRGRSTSVEVLPFSFREYLRYHGVEPEGPLSGGAAERSRLESAFDDYLVAGGFPGVQSLPPVDRLRMLQDYVELVIFRDVVERWEVANLVALKQLVSQLVSSFSREFTINRLYNSMRSEGIAVSKDTLHTYLDHLVDARLLHVVSLRRASYRARQVNPRKIYAVDPGLASAVAHPSADDTGHLLENAVYLELRRRHGRLHDGAITYYSGPDGSADFVVERMNDDPLVVQVCATLGQGKTREREIRGAAAAMSATGAASATIVTLYEQGSVETDSGTVLVRPAWRWMLASDEG